MRRFPLILAVALLACDSTGGKRTGGDVALMGMDRDPAAAEIARSERLKRAQAEIDQGHPWRATQIVSPSLRDGRQRTHAALLVAARAAAGWDGWAEVERLLGREPWLNAEFDGEGSELLVRSALERDDDAVALARASTSLRSATSPVVRGVRQALLARALERNNMFDSAAAMYMRASESLPSVRDWLYLRAAGSEVDSARRAKLFARVTLPPAKDRIRWTEAQARERFSDALGAASRYAALGATVQALRLRLSVASDSGTRDAVKRELLTFIRTHDNTADARAAVDVLDRGFTSFSPGEDLLIARSVDVVSPGRAITAFSRTLAGASASSPSDRFEYAQALARVGKSRDAMAQFALVQGPLAGRAMYQRARILLTSGSADRARPALRDVVTRFAPDTMAASMSLFLLADLSTDDGDDATARATYQQLYSRYPSSARAPNARFNAAIIALAGGKPTNAAYEFDSVQTLMPRSDEALAATYWAGRAWEASGNAGLAKQRWQRVIAEQPMSYYAFAAARRLRAPAWKPADPRVETIQRISAVDSGVARIALLERLGMDVEARFEYDALDAAAMTSPRRAAATADAFIRRGQTSRSIRLAQKLIEGGRTDIQSYRLLFPLFDREELALDAKANALDPVLVAALIRQESNFNPRALSVAGARGLMQVLPSVGEEVSRALTYPVWSPALLFDPDANLQLGTAHLAAVMKQHGSIPRVLAAYNAGGSRVVRWSTKSGMTDPELFAERIPFAETRDYVRVVQRNVEIYRQLYDWR